MSEQRNFKPLTDEEVERIRQLLVIDSRRQWLVLSMAGVAKWLTVIMGGWVSIKLALSEIPTWLK